VLFDGITYDSDQDSQRLGSQLFKVRDLMKDGAWRGLGDIAGKVGGTEAGVSARLRDLRKYRFGQHLVLAKRVSKGYWEYKLVIDKNKNK
jgi:hypothetical protein